MTATPELVTDLKRQVLLLEDDLRHRVASQPDVLARWKDEHVRATRAERTASSWVEWRDDRVTQAAVAWVLTTVFIRFCEDNALLKPVWISGPPARRQEALDAQNACFRENPTHTDREWLLQAIGHLARVPATKTLVEEHSMLWSVQPSGGAATALLAFWRERGTTGALRHDLADPDLSTRFLGDLYQDLSEHARDAYALLQTPEFVEEFILDQTMEPALAERPLEGFRLIDPACGSGHFLLGAFARLLRRWETYAPAMPTRERVQVCLDAVSGVDVNPFAVAISRFRITLAALIACGENSLERAPEFLVWIEAGDSLLHGHSQPGFSFGTVDGLGAANFAYSNESLDALQRILAPGSFDVVVGNPPYITVRDKSLNQVYRGLYPSCKGKYALTVPFMELFYELAKPRRADQPAGWTGQITSNSFMKREFGSKLIEDFLTTKDLVRVIDTSGAFIPGHGTPTVILIGRNQRPVGSAVRSVLGIRTEPGRPSDPTMGLVWRSIVDHLNLSSYEDQWISVADVARNSLATHPWSLSGGGADELLLSISRASADTLGSRTERIGVFGIMGLDDAMTLQAGVAERTGREADGVAQLVLGDSVRDFRITGTMPTWFPYTGTHDLRPLADFPGWARALWPLRTELGNRATFTKGTYFSDGRPFYEWHQIPYDRNAHKWTICFAFVATHNHFVLDRGGKVFNRSAPIVKLPKDASEDEHLSLLALLNSSTAGFWLRQNSHNKGRPGAEAGGLTNRGNTGSSSPERRFRTFHCLRGSLSRTVAS